MENLPIKMMLKYPLQSVCQLTNLLQIDFTFIKSKKENIKRNKKGKIIVFPDDLRLATIENKKVKKRYALPKVEEQEEQEIEEEQKIEEVVSKEDKVNNTLLAYSLN